ncbi:MAG: transcriptional activator RfaH [Pseudomonadota bacterium]
MTLRWYVVHTQPQAEARALFNLLRQGFSAYLPRYAKRWRHAGRTEMRAAPLFPRYLFVALDLAVERWRPILSTIGVSHLVRHGDRPAPVPAGVVEAIHVHEDEAGLVRLAAVAPFRKGDRVRILDGTFAEQVGLFETACDRRRVVLLLELLGRQVRVLIPEGSIAAAA